jgi:DNA-binding MarR family transcriptional regulator
VENEIIELLRTVYSFEEKGDETTRTNISKRMSIPGSKLSEQLDIAQSQGLIERIVKKEGKGRPKVLTKLTEKGLKIIGVGITSGSSSKAGGELHRALLFRAKDWLESQDYYVKIPEQGGRIEQADMLAYSKASDGLGREIAVEVETSVNHPEQIVKNYEKNASQGRFVIFIVPDEEIQEGIGRILSKANIKNFKIYTI